MFHFNLEEFMGGTKPGDIKGLRPLLMLKGGRLELLPDTALLSRTG